MKLLKIKVEKNMAIIVEKINIYNFNNEQKSIKLGMLFLILLVYIKKYLISIEYI